MPAPTTTPEFIDLIDRSGLQSRDAVTRTVGAVAVLPADPARAASVLVHKGLLTPFQAKLLLAGKHRGFRLGSYVVRDLLGQGGMGTVYLAEHETLRRRVALKVLAADQSNRVVVERFLREARAAAALDHPNIVRVFDVGRHRDVHYLVMEYVNGKTLEAQQAAGGPLPLSRAVEYMAQAAAGLQHAHEKGFVHRDIKPANLMVTKDGTLKILDMGLARSAAAADNLTAVLDKGALVGTADYIAPEQAIGAPGVDVRADIYSLGATFFALVAGRPPFAGNTTQKLLAHQSTAPPSLLTLDPTVPPALAAVVDKMMAKRPDERFQTPAEVIAALTPWLSASGKLLAGVSGTNLASGRRVESMVETLSGGSTGRLPRVVPDGPEIEEDEEPADEPVPARWSGRTGLALLAAGLLVGGGAGAALVAALLRGQ